MYFIISWFIYYVFYVKSITLLYELVLLPLRARGLGKQLKVVEIWTLHYILLLI